MTGRFSDRPRKSVQGPSGCSRPPFSRVTTGLTTRVATGARGAPIVVFRAGRGHSAGSTCFAAMLLAVSESGPGCGTKIASR